MKNIFLHFILTFSFLFFRFFCFSANPYTDSLLINLKTAKEVTNKVDILNDLSWELLKIGDFDEAMQYANDALILVHTNPDNKNDKIENGDILKRGESKAYNNIGIIFWYRGNYPKALENHFNSLKIKEELLEQAKRKGNSDHILWSKNAIAGSYGNIGNIFIDLGNYPVALKNAFSALKIFEEIGERKKIAISYNNIALIYDYQANYPEALKNHFASLKIKEELLIQAKLDKNSGEIQEIKKGISSSYNNIGVIYCNQNNYLEALRKFAASLEIRKEIGDKDGIAASYNSIGNIYLNQAISIKNRDSAQSKLNEALKSQLISLKIYKEIEDQNGITASYESIGNVYARLKKYKEALQYLNKGLDLAKVIGSKNYIKESYFSLAGLDSSLQNYKGAYENHKLYILYRDSIDNEETRKKTVQAQMTYDFEKKKAVADAEHKKELEKQQAIAREKNRKQSLVILFVVCGLLLVIIFAALIFRSLRITKKQKQIIEVQKEKVEVQNEEITKQKHLVEEKNHEISSSISYAKRIQRSFLTSPSLIKRHLPDHFILFKPRDVVSGDFYWMHQKGDYSYFCVADCTGHGIPGAFMSLIGMGVLNEIVFSKNIYETDDILNELRRIVILAVNPEDAIEEGKDGMDLVYLRFHLPSKELQYSSANNSFYLYRNGELIEYKPDKMPVGSFGEYEKPFTQHTIQLEAEDIIYAITDGYADQFGGPKGKKFKYKPLEEILVSNANKPMPLQLEILESRFNDWKGDLEQVDDVTIIGIRI